MSWTNVTHRCTQEYQIDLTQGITPTSRKQIIEAIATEFYNIPRVRIAAHVDRSIQKETFPSHIKNLLTCIQYSMR